MDPYEVHKKVQSAVAAIEEYQKTRTGRSIWDDDIKKGLDVITEKRHMLASSGQKCPRCGGTGTV